MTKRDHNSILHMLDFFAYLAGSIAFSNIDLVKGYQQIPIAEKDIHKTTVITLFGRFEFLRVPFRLKNAALTFQRLWTKSANHLILCLFISMIYLWPAVCRWKASNLFSCFFNTDFLWLGHQSEQMQN